MFSIYQNRPAEIKNIIRIVRINRKTFNKLCVIFPKKKCGSAVNLRNLNILNTMKTLIILKKPTCMDDAGSSKIDIVRKEVNRMFNVSKEVEEEKDIIFIAKKF